MGVVLFVLLSNDSLMKPTPLSLRNLVQNSLYRSSRIERAMKAWPCPPSMSC